MKTEVDTSSFTPLSSPIAFAFAAMGSSFDAKSKAPIPCSLGMHPLNTYKKNAFILIEVMIAIALLSLCAIPLVSFPRKEFEKQRFSLFRLELERQAEVFFYEALLESNNMLWEKYKCERINNPDITGKKIIQVEGLGSKEMYYHCHIYYWGSHKHPTFRMHFYDICLNEKDTHDNPYKFSIFVKKAEEKSKDPHVEKYHEGISTDVQTLRQREGNTD